MLRSTILAVLLTIAPAAAFANQCPALMAEIDAALPSATLTDDAKTQVMELRAKGEELHSAGDHDGSIEALEEAKGILGI